MAESRLFLRLGSHSEKDYLLKTAKLFSGVIVGANLVESTPGATISLALKLMGGMQLQFAIDPMTYTFGMDLSYITSETIDRTAKVKGTRKVGLKKSFAGLARQFGGLVENAVLKSCRHLMPADFRDQNAVRDLCRITLEYQLNRMREICQADPQLREIASEFPRPSFVFSPYFYIPDSSQSESNDWEVATLRIADMFGNLSSPVPKYAVLCISRKIAADVRRLVNISQRICDTGCDGCWVWVSDLREEQITASELEGMKAAASSFEAKNKALYNLHGGYLSALLSKYGLQGFSHGIGYGESKDVVPVIGVTVPTVNYHLPPLHVRVPILELERALSALGITTAAEFHDRICDCTICKGVLKGDLKNLREFGDFVLKIGNIKKSQTPDSAKRCRFHFLLARRKELDFVNGHTLAEAKAQLMNAANEYSVLPPFLGLQNRTDHLKLWSAYL